MNDAEIKLQVKLDTKSINSSISEITAKTNKLSDSFKNAGSKMTLGLTTPITGLIGLGIKYNAEMEQYQAGLETMLGSTEKANKMLSELKTMASKTPFETTDLIKASQKMLAFGLDSNKTTKYLQMLGDVSMGNKNKLDSLTLAFSQIGSSGRATMEDINQMIDQGFNPLQIISEKTGESMLSLRDRVSAGKVSFEEITGAFEIATSEGGRFFGAMDKQSTTTEGKLSTLKDGFMTAAGTLTTSLLPILTQLVGKLTEIFNWFSSLDSGTQTFILGMLGIVAVLGPIIGLITTLTTGIGLLGKAFLFLTANPIGIFLTALILLIIFVIQHFKELKYIATVIGYTLLAVFKGLGNGIAFTFKGIVNTIITAINIVTRVLNVFMSGILAPLNGIISGLNLIPGVSIPHLNLSIPKIPYLSTGTNMVQREGMAYLHEGEAVVPKKYNPAIGGMGMGQTIVLQMPDIVMDGKKVANSTTPYITRNLKFGGAMT